MTNQRSNLFFKIMLLICSFTIAVAANGQESLNKVSPNGLELNTSLDKYRGELFLLTGEETEYVNYPNIRQNVLKNIANGIREGIYQGNIYNLINGKRASRTTMFFFKGELYKVRWSFQLGAIQDLEGLANEMNQFLFEKYGFHSTEIPSMLMAWEKRKRYLQTFLDESEFQIEYRDPRVQRKVEKLN